MVILSENQYYTNKWKHHTEITKVPEYKEYEISKENMPMYILDDDCRLCAYSYTTEHLKKYIEYITWSICRKYGDVSAKRESAKHDRIDYMFYNQRTAYWYYQLYIEMQEVYKKRFGSTYKVTPLFKEEWLNDLTKVYGPIEVKNKAYKPVRLPHPDAMYKHNKDIFKAYEKQIFKLKTSITRYRIMYMINGYLNSEFPLGAPAWYNCMRGTIYQAFNKMTRMYYKIDTNVDGVYSYFYSNDNKNWFEIKPVSMELRGLIDSIIFAREV